MSEKQQPHHGEEVFIAGVVAVGSQIVCGRPKPLFNRGDVFKLWHEVALSGFSRAWRLRSLREKLFEIGSLKQAVTVCRVAAHWEFTLFRLLAQRVLCDTEMFGCFGRFQVFVELGHAALILENQKCEVYQSLLAIESKQNEGSTEVPNNDCESRRNERFDISTIIACRNVVTRNQTSHFQARSLKLF